MSKRSASLTVLCVGLGTVFSLTLPQAAHAGVAEQRTFEGKGSSVNSEQAKRTALHEAKEQMGEFEAWNEQTCTVVSKHAELETLLKRNPPIYVWKAEIVANCSE